MIERLSIELTDRCSKACWFCYNDSRPDGATEWSPGDVIAFVRDCVRCGTHDISFGGGEPLEYPYLAEVLGALHGQLHRSVTTNGLLLDETMISALAATGLEKTHVSIHFPERTDEVGRVIDQVRALEAAGIRSGVNLLVRKEGLAAARKALERVHDAGIGPERVILLPMRLHDVPSPEDLAWVSKGQPFQSTSCLCQCGPSPRFVSIDTQKCVGWCSYTTARRRLTAPTYRALTEAIDNLELIPCGSPENDREYSG